MDVPQTLAAELALTQQAVTLSVIKQAAQADRALVAILDEAINSVPVSSFRGVNLNTSA